MSLTQNGIKRFSNGILCLQAGFVYLFYLHNTYFIWMKYCFKHFSLWQIFPDTACRRKILDLTVKCSHSGCPWTGELRAVEVKRKGKLNTFELCSIILNYIIRQSNYFHSYFFPQMIDSVKQNRRQSKWIMLDGHVTISCFECIVLRMYCLLPKIFLIKDG